MIISLFATKKEEKARKAENLALMNFIDPESSEKYTEESLNLYAETLRTKFNAFARKQGCGRCTGLETTQYGEVGMVIIEENHPCFRKITTNQKVPHSYRNNFGWKNTYYDRASCTLAVNPSNLLYLGHLLKEK